MMAEQKSALRKHRKKILGPQDSAKTKRCFSRRFHCFVETVHFLAECYRLLGLVKVVNLGCSQPWMGMTLVTIRIAQAPKKTEQVPMKTAQVRQDWAQVLHCLAQA